MTDVATAIKNRVKHTGFLVPYCYPAGKKLRLGAQKDGGYVIVMPEEKPDEAPWDLYISAGVGDEESFSSDFINGFGLTKNQCWAFDGTISKYPQKYAVGGEGRGMWFIRKNIGPEMTATTVNLGKLIAENANIFLKMDIEGGEYPWLASLSFDQLRKFKQIVIEFHDLLTEPLARIIYEKLFQTHAPVHVHGNSHGGLVQLGNKQFPNVVEVTYIRRNDPGFLDVSGMARISNGFIAPTAGLDYPNEIGRPDIVFHLG